MRLINTSTLEFEEFIGSNIPPYAILSHTWGTGEVSHQEYVTSGRATRWKDGYAKIIKTCELARLHRLAYVWVDTCCIDKTSSAELTEAINSMFAWYRDAAICIAYLSDLEPGPPNRLPLFENLSRIR